jgi:hypothetical protein
LGNSGPSFEGAFTTARKSFPITRAQGGSRSLKEAAAAVVIVVVGGQARDVGKTRAVCDIIAATPEASWVAIKITPHEHEISSTGHADTDRYLRAGASEAHLLKFASQIELPRATNLIVESISVLEQIDPDLFIFVANSSSPEWKESARRWLWRADAVIEGKVPVEVLDRIRRLLSVQRP